MRFRTVSLRVCALTCASAGVLGGALLLMGTGARAQNAGAVAAATPDSPGKRVYDAHCVECHGRDGKGDGPAASTLFPHPRDFTSGRYKIKSTETGSLPTDDDLARSIRVGLPGTSMPDWGGILSEQDIRDVAGYLKTFSPRFQRDFPEPIAAGAPLSPSPESMARGAGVYRTLQCSKCHGEDGRGKGATATSFEDDWGFPMQAADLAEPWTFRGGSDPADIFMRFRAGMSGTPMPSYKGSATDPEMWDLASYVVSLRRKPLWEMSAEEVAAFYAERDAEAAADPVARGEHLVSALDCSLCHSPADEERRPFPGMRFAGGLRMQLQPFGTVYSGNLTSDGETGLGNWTDDEIKRAITKGIRRDGSRMLPFPMDWASYSTIAPSDLDAVVAYLRTIPPVYNRVPSPGPASLPVHLWGKFQMLVLGKDLPSFLYAGNAGTPKGGQR